MVERGPSGPLQLLRRARKLPGSEFVSISSTYLLAARTPKSKPASALVHRKTASIPKSFSTGSTTDHPAITSHEIQMAVVVTGQPKVGTVCGKSASTVLFGGRAERPVPTETNCGEPRIKASRIYSAAAAVIQAAVVDRRQSDSIACAPRRSSTDAAVSRRGHGDPIMSSSTTTGPEPSFAERSDRRLDIQWSLSFRDRRSRVSEGRRASPRRSPCWISLRCHSADAAGSLHSRARSASAIPRSTAVPRVPARIACASPVTITAVPR